MPFKGTPTRTLPAPLGLIGAPELSEPPGLFHVYGSPIAVFVKSRVMKRTERSRGAVEFEGFRVLG